MDNEKEILKSKIKKVNDCFGLNSFIKLIRECTILLERKLTFPELEQWLFKFLKDDDLHVVSGILAVLYFDFGNVKNSLLYADEAANFFPGCPIWEAINHHCQSRDLQNLQERWEVLLAELYS